MSNYLQRLLLVGIGVPVLVLLILYVPQFNHLPIAILVLLFCAGSGLELLHMIEPGSSLARKTSVLFLCLSPVLATYLYGLLFNQESLISIWLIPSSLFLLAGFSLSAATAAFPISEKNIPGALEKLSYNAFYIMYPGMLGSSIMAMLSIKEHSAQYLLWFMIIVFGNDSLAWLVGITIGKKRNIFMVSPKKSLEGLIAGMSASFIAATLGPILFSAIGPVFWLVSLCIGLFCGMAAIMGDLLESAIKRSCKVKDSGFVIPGRGGLLDSFDSLLFTAPVFLIILLLSGMVS